MLRFLAMMALAVGTTAAEAAAPQLTTGNGVPLPDPLRQTQPANGTDPLGSAAYKAIVFGRLQTANHVGEATNGVPGTAGVHFRIGDDGALLEARIVRPSGNPAFDANVLAMVRKAAPFPAPPKGAQRAFDATIKFNPKHKP